MLPEFGAAVVHPLAYRPSIKAAYQRADADFAAAGLGNFVPVQGVNFTTSGINSTGRVFTNQGARKGNS